METGSGTAVSAATAGEDALTSSYVPGGSGEKAEPALFVGAHQLMAEAQDGSCQIRRVRSIGAEEVRGALPRSPKTG